MEGPALRKALEGWPKRPLGASVYLYVDPQVDGDRPRTLGEWMARDETTATG